MIIHWIIVLISSLYVFIRTSNKYDIIYFVDVFAIILSWAIIDKECLISYWEKLCIDDKYVFGSEYTKLPFMDHVLPKCIVPIVGFTLGVLLIYNLHEMMNIYKIPLALHVSILAFTIIPFSKRLVEENGGLVKLKKSFNAAMKKYVFLEK